MTTPVGEHPQDWGPARRRWFGLDRRTLGPALVVLLVGVLLIYGWPALNTVVPWHNEIKPGDVLDLGDSATAVPPVGWQLEDGVLTGTAGASPEALKVVLVKGGATIELRGTAYSGTAEEFLTQVQRAEGVAGPGVLGPRAALTTGAGLVGVVQAGRGPGGDGLDAAFKMAVGNDEDARAAPALLVRVRTAPGQFEQYRGDVTALLHSIAPGPRP
ncbi:hypothetical protein [Dactylosporangium sp. CA-233914]|uniref:hypothetical protein n=1 Tax=Dactylosporangium sp. CA-233914 TaxID=3239934 RepID=UPI003D8FAF82